MAHLLTWPKHAELTADDGSRWVASVAPGRVVLDCPERDGDLARAEFSDPGQLRRLGMLAHAAAVDHDTGVQAAAAKALADRRLARKARGETLGLLDRPYVDVPEPPMHREATLPA